MARKPSTWYSTGRSPMRQPPTRGTVASPTRLSNGPIIRMGMRLTPEYCSDTSEEVMTGVCTDRVWSSSHSTWVPTSRNIPRMTCTSVMRGTLDSTQRSEVNSVATSCLVTAFLAPPGVTSP